MYQALVRITKDDRIAADTSPPGTPAETPRLDWAALLDSLLRRLRDVQGGAPDSGSNRAGGISGSGG